VKYYCVFDTNVLISYFLNNNKNSSINILIDNSLIKEKKIIPVLNKDILNEYLNVLNRDKFDNKVDRKSAIEFISVLNKDSINIETEKDYVTFLDKEQKCRMTDTKDFVFYNIVLEAKDAISNEDSYLVTGNKKHFPIECFIKSPKEMLDLINEREKFENSVRKSIVHEESDIEWARKILKEVQETKDDNSLNIEDNRDKNINEHDGRD